jgi:hypothetical protein
VSALRNDHQDSRPTRQLNSLGSDYTMAPGVHITVYSQHDSVTLGRRYSFDGLPLRAAHVQSARLSH